MAGDLRASLNHGHPGAETPHGLCQFKADKAAAQDNEMFRQAVEIESFDVGHGLGRRQAGPIRQSRPGT